MQIFINDITKVLYKREREREKFNNKGDLF